MSAATYKLTREIAIVLSVILSVFLIGQSELLRALMNIILLFLFIWTSKLFERKYKNITISYIFVFVIIYFVDSLIAAACNYKMLNELNMSGKYGYWIGDYYDIYFGTSLIFYIIIILYLKFVKTSVNYSITHKMEMGSIESKNFCIGSVLLICAYFLLGQRHEIVVPVFVFLLTRILFIRKNRAVYVVWFIALACIMKDIFLSRYKLVVIVLPVLVMLVILNNRRKISLTKINIIFVTAIFLIGLYGVISEVYKLNTSYGAKYNLSEIIKNTSLLYTFFNRQFYRIFVIWIKLGGYIIYHTNQNGFYYGITYIKSLSGILGFEYISLPRISAIYDKASYAQPGLLAEGYANFGIFGAVLNLLLVFFLMEYFCARFYKKPSYSNLFYMVIPFSKILLDGGSLNSALYLIIMCFLLDILNFVSNQKKCNRKIDCLKGFYQQSK